MGKFKKLYTIIISTFLLQAITAQVTIKGVVKDNKNNPVAGASIAIKDSYDGATSDSLGRYSFKTFEKGTQLLLVSNIGFKSFEQQVKLESSIITIDVVLKQEVTELTAVVLSAGTFEASDRKRAAAVLDPIDIVTTASANGDITQALKTLPGAQQVGESEGLYVRGGTAAETKTFIDGTLVNNFFFSSVPNIAQFGRFSPFIFKGTVFSTGGYSALYGQALSSALILESIDLPEQSSANLGISVLSLSAGYQHLSKNKKSSFGGSYSYTDLSLAFAVIKQRQDYSRVPAYHNADANFRIKTSKTGMLKYYGYFSSNRLAFTTNSIDSLGYMDKFAISNTNHYHNLSWKENLPKRWKLQTGISYTNNKDNINSGMQDANKSDVILGGLESKTFGIILKGNYFNAKAVLEKKLKGLSAIRFGSEYNYTNDESEYTAYNGQKYPGKLKENIKSLFAEADVYATNDLAIKGGLRMEHSSSLRKTNLAPRFSIAYKIGKGSQASVAYGIFYQNPERRYLPSPNELTYMKATHYILQYQKVLNQQSFRAEVFYKKYDNLVKTAIVGFTEAAVSNNGFGDAKGIEFFWRDRKTIKNFDYWISYSYLDTKRDFLNFPFAITPNFAAKHTASLVTKKFVQSLKMNFNASYNYSSGRPYYNIGFDGSNYKFNDRGTIPDYHNVSFAINYLPTIGKKDAKSFAVYVLQVSNIFNIKQTYGYTYSYNGQRKEAIVPTSRMFVFIGAFISFGVDRSEEVINNGL
ncbi:MAG TPA: carboxypeptidase-like regulatory domain-containing protein [Chitinophagaceae bacterium]|nr:carboxypeptidase-like regulatory domain-containing protein [Chitinophagaceae bacterium]HNU13502.1 carboxypeptidase-like regulatory domain-containing protein [Chitinophagaceae bacterium]